MLNTYPCNPFPISSEQLHKGDNEDLQAQINAIKDGTAIDSFGDVETALETKTDTDVIAPEFDAEAGTYAIGDLVMYEGKLYEFTSAHETAGEWDSTEVTEKTVADEIDDVKSGLTNVNSNLTNLSSNLNMLKVQEFIIASLETKNIKVNGTALIFSDRGAVIIKSPYNRGVQVISNYAVTVNDVDGDSFTITSATGGSTAFIALCRHGVEVTDVE